MVVDVVNCWKTTCLPLRRREGKSRPSLVNVLTVCVADPRERFEEVGDHLPDLSVRIENDIANLVIDKAGRKRTTVFTAAYLVEDPAAQSGLDDMQFSFAHRALEPEQQAIVEVGRVVHAVFIEDERVGQGADLQQPMPVRIVSGEAGYLQPHDDPPAPHADIGHQVLEAFAPRRRCAGFALVAVDDDDLVVAPSKSDRATAKIVLTFGALDVLHDLSHRRLLDVEIGAPLEMMRLNLELFVHAVFRSGVASTMAASKWMIVCRSEVSSAIGRPALSGTAMG